MFFEFARKDFAINLLTLLCGKFLRDFQRETKRLIQVECIFAGNCILLIPDLLKLLQTLCKRLLELCRFSFQPDDDVGFFIYKLWICFAERRDDFIDDRRD